MILVLVLRFVHLPLFKIASNLLLAAIFDFDDVG
jgi:hypothetical protein